MPQSIILPFPVIKLSLASGEHVAMPLSDPNAFHLGTTAGDLAKKYERSLQESQLDKGKFDSLMDELWDRSFTPGKLTVSFPADKDGLSFPAFEIEFDYFSQLKGGNLWGILPALGIEANGTTAEELERQLREVVKIEFTSNRRLESVQNIFAAHWFSEVTLEMAEIRLQTYTFTELNKLKKEQKQELLSKVAEKLTIRQQVTYRREEELTLMERMLKSRFSRNILLIGASGTGKTALVWELAHRLQHAGNEVNVWETTASVLLKELTGDTGWQYNLSLLIKELMLKGDILFVRNLAELFEVGRYEGNPVSMGEYLQSALSRGEITLITECTPGERANIEAKYPNYLPFFQTIYLQEPASEDLEFIITQKIQALAGQRRIRIELEAIREMIRLHRRFSPYSGMPGKPIRFLESILMGNSDPVLPTKKSKKKTSKDNELPLPFTLTRQVVLRHFCEESGIPQLMIDPEIRMDTKAIQRRFNTQVFGQEKAVNAAVNTLAAVKTALTRTGKPIASFLFIGPTGVGKTELAKVMAEFMFGNRERLVRFDMSEYSDFWSVMRLTGESYFSDGLLTSAVKREPFCLILFDEIEKADQSFLDLLLQILSEGRLTDSRGQLVNFCSAIIIMTSNVGASNFQLHPISYLKNQKVQRMEDHFIQAAERYFRPEFFNRIDSVLAFEPLSPEIMRFVVEREIDLFKNREGIHFRHLDLTLDDAVLDFLAKEGYDPLYGARYLQRTIREKLIAPLAQELNQFDYDDHLVVQIRLTSDTADGEKKTLRIIIESDPLGFDLLMEQWDKLTLAEQASHERRKWMVMQESPLFIRLQNEWEMLEISLARLGNAFWKNGVQAKLYADTSAIRERIRQLQTTIQNLEEEIALASMEQGIFQTDFNDRLEQWKEDFFQLLEDVYSLLFPKQNTCHLAIYGSDLEKLLHFYLRLFKEKGFQVKEAHSVWFHEKYATEKKLPRLPEKSPPQVTTEEEEDTEKPQNEATAYIRQPCSQQDLADQRFFPPDSNARMFGIELQVSGHIAWLYLKEEKGIQHWETDVKDDFTAYHIAVNLQKAPPPDGIHRNMFYQNSKPRRIVRQETITDTKLGIAETLKQEEMPLYLKEKLDERLRVNIGQAFRESEPEG